MEKDTEKLKDKVYKILDTLVADKSYIDVAYEDVIKLLSSHEASTRKAEREAVLEMIKSERVYEWDEDGYCKECGRHKTHHSHRHACKKRDSALDSLTDKIKQRV